jgi:hypothetical protein
LHRPTTITTNTIPSAPPSVRFLSPRHLPAPRVRRQTYNRAIKKTYLS